VNFSCAQLALLQLRIGRPLDRYFINEFCCALPILSEIKHNSAESL